MGKAKTKKKPKRKPSAYNNHIGREMRAGKTMKQAAASWKKGGKKSSPKRKTGKSNPKGETRTMTKNSFNMNKIYSLANKVAFFAPYASIALNPHITVQAKVNEGVYYLTGFDMDSGTWSFEGVKKGWTPYFVTKIITAVVPRLTSFIKGLL